MDGSGKTNHSYQIINHLRLNGTKCKYVWFGTAYFLSYPFMIICRMLGLTKTYHLANGQTTSEHQYYRNKLVSSIWPWVQLFDLLLLVNLRVKLFLLSGNYVVCDRFIPDILVELITDLSEDCLYKKKIGQLAIKMIPKHSLIILLDVSEKTAWQRKNDIPEMNSLFRRKKAYDLVSNYMKIPAVSAEESVAIVQKQLETMVDNWQNQYLGN